MKSKAIDPTSHDATVSEFAPTQKQIDTLARRLMPEIKKFFANEQIQKEFVNWQEKQKTEK